MNNSLPMRITGGIVILLILAVSGFITGWITRGWKYDSQYKKSYIQAMAEVKTQDLANQTLAQEYNRKTALYEKEMESLNGQVKTEIAQHSIYSDCSLPDSGVQLLNSAVDSVNKARSSK